MRLCMIPPFAHLATSALSELFEEPWEYVCQGRPRHCGSSEYRASICIKSVIANEAYVATFDDKGALPLPPAKKLIVVTCMDARLLPEAHLGLHEGDAHIIRNAGGVAADAIRSIVISQRLLGTREIAIFHHTDCGMLTFETEHLRDIIKSSSPGDDEVAKLVNDLHFHEFNDLEGAVKKDVAFLESHPLLLKETKVTGWLYAVETGKIQQVA